MKQKLQRICIYPKDVAKILGKTERYGQALLRTIKKDLGKQKHHSVSVYEFCTHKGLNPEEVLPLLQD